MRRTVLTTVFLLLGCNNDLPPYDIYTDLRVLAMQSTPPELLYNAPGPIDTQVGAVVVDPRGGTLQYTWSLCPVESSLACDDFAALQSVASRDDQIMLQDLRALQMSGNVDPTTDPNTGAVSYVIPSFDPVAASVALYGVDRTPELVAYYFETFFDDVQGSWPLAILDLTSAHGDTLTAVKRLVLNIHNLQVVAEALAQEYGLNICSATNSSPDCLSFPARTANANPAFLPLQWSPSGAAAGPFSALPAVAYVRPGQAVRLRPSFTADSAQTYFILQPSLQTRRFQVVNETELFSVSWFADAGAFLYAFTWAEFTVNLDNTFTAPTAWGPVTIWAVARDQRGGEVWQSAQLVVAGP